MRPADEAKIAAVISAAAIIIIPFIIDAIFLHLMIPRWLVLLVWVLACGVGGKVGTTVEDWHAEHSA